MEIWQVLLTSSLVSSLVSLSFAWGRDFLKEQRESRAEGQTVARSLEKYVRRCEWMLERNDLARSDYMEHEDDAAFKAIQIPTFELPNVSWKLLDHLLVDRVKGFPDRIAEASDSILVQWNHYGLDDLMDVSYLEDRKMVELGEIAWKLAVQIRRALGLPLAHAEEECSTALAVLSEMRHRYEAEEKRP